MPTSERPPLQAVVFDMDGVLMDTEPMWREVELAVFNDLGCGLVEADSVATMGIRLPEVVEHWYARTPWDGPSTAEVTETILAGVIGAVRARGTAMPGVEEAVAAARAAGFRTAVASSSSHRLIDAVLDSIGIRDAIELVCSADDDAAGKPAPDVYLRTAASLGVAPPACLAIEDSPNGVRAAVAAGMRCVSVPDPLTRDHPAHSAAECRLSSLWELPELLATECRLHR